VVGAAAFVCVWGALEASVSEARKTWKDDSQIKCHMDFMMVVCSRFLKAVELTIGCAEANMVSSMTGSQTCLSLTFGSTTKRLENIVNLVYENSIIVAFILN